MKALPLLLAALALSACATAPPTSPGKMAEAQKPEQVPRPPVDKIDTSDACGASAFRSFVGKPASTPGVPAASRSVRHIAPGSIVTMDFSEGRLNFDLDANGVILKVYCG